MNLFGLGDKKMCENCECAARNGSEEFKKQAIRRYYACMVNVQERTAQQAFMSTCAFYKYVTPETPDWRVPKEVAMILNPGLRI